MKKGLEARLTGPHEQDHNDDQHLARPQLLVLPHLLHGHLICKERDTRSQLLSSPSHTSVTKTKILVLISISAHTSDKTRFENMLMATWDGSDKI